MMSHAPRGFSLPFFCPFHTQDSDLWDPGGHVRSLAQFPMNAQEYIPICMSLHLPPPSPFTVEPTTKQTWRPGAGVLESFFR